ncbi:MAG: arginine N-succinyltransferase [Gammaproteobacteria bacterium]|nr:arginine N-succinyltransferase [Gammaproteobacteria bacterium]
MQTAIEQENKPPKKGISGVHIIWIVLVTIILTAVVTFWLVRSYIYPKDFEPVELNAAEQQTLNAKLKTLGYEPEEEIPVQAGSNETDQQWLRPEPYSEAGGKREVSFSERELNAMIAKNSDLAKKLAFDMSDNLLSSRLLISIDPDFPVLGGKTLRVAAGVEMAFRNNKPVVVLKGVSVMGIPVPNAWLGGLKNIDLINEFGDEQGFWSGFSDGVEEINIKEGKLRVKLKE